MARNWKIWFGFLVVYLAVPLKHSSLIRRRAICSWLEMVFQVVSTRWRLSDFTLMALLHGQRWLQHLVAVLFPLVWLCMSLRKSCFSMVTRRGHSLAIATKANRMASLLAWITMALTCGLSKAELRKLTWCMISRVMKIVSLLVVGGIACHQRISLDFWLLITSMVLNNGSMFLRSTRLLIRFWLIRVLYKLMVSVNIADCRMRFSGIHTISLMARLIQQFTGLLVLEWILGLRAQWLIPWIRWWLLGRRTRLAQAL